MRAGEDGCAGGQHPRRPLPYHNEESHDVSWFHFHFGWQTGKVDPRAGTPDRMCFGTRRNRSVARVHRGRFPIVGSRVGYHPTISPDSLSKNTAFAETRGKSADRQ
jgi:hypothetical protein